MNLSRVLFWSAKRVPRHIAIVSDGETITYEALGACVNDCSRFLCENGVTNGSRVVLLLQNSIDFIVYFFAVVRLEAIAVPLNPGATSHELSLFFSDSEPDVMIFDAQIVDQEFVNYVRSNSGRILVIDKDNHKRDNKSYEDAENTADADRGIDAKARTTRGKAIASINYTYRGLGYPLGAITTHASYIHGVERYYRSTGMNDRDVIMMLHPVFQIYSLVGCVLTPLLLGATVIIPRISTPRHVVEVINKHKVTIVTAVPAFYALLVKYFDIHKFSLGSVKFGLCGGSGMPLKLYNEIKQRFNFELVQGYGLTETLPVTCNPIEKNKPLSVGVPGSKTSVKIDTNYEMLNGQRCGEVLIKSPTLTQGYFRNTDLNAFFKDWFRTGDYGYFDKDGYLHVDGLKKKCVKVAGQMVDLKEVESIALRYPCTQQVSLRVINDYVRGVLLSMELITIDDGKFTEFEVRTFMRKYLSSYKIPHIITIKKTSTISQTKLLSESSVA